MTVKLAVVSDIHARPNGEDTGLIDAINSRVEEISPDVFVIAGDLSERVDNLRVNLGRLRVSGCHNVYVPGNHDVWFENDSGLDSLTKYSRAIGEACRAAGFIHLPDEPLVLDSLAFVGSIGWYDYSLRRTDLDISQKQYEEKHYQGAFWMDYYSVDWPFSDRDATELFNRKLGYDLATLPDHVQRVVYVSHHLPFKELTFYKGTLPWDFFSAYMGSVSTGDILLKDGRVILAIAGHSHIRKMVTVDGILAITVPIGYGRPRSDGMSAFAGSAVVEILIDGKQVRVPNFKEGDLCAGLPYAF